MSDLYSPEFYKQLASSFGQDSFIKQMVLDKLMKDSGFNEMLSLSRSLQRPEDKLLPQKTSEEKIQGGKADGKPDSKYPSSEITKGTKVEMEHTDDPDIAKEITKDHLEEHKSYYIGLRLMEKALEKEAGVREWLAGLALAGSLSAPMAAKAGPAEMAAWKAMTSKLTPQMTQRVGKINDKLSIMESLGLGVYGKDRLAQELAKIEAGKSIAKSRAIDVSDIQEIYNKLIGAEKKVLGGKGIGMGEVMSLKEKIPSTISNISQKLEEYVPPRTLAGNP
ncbi:MAG: hypothetical protein ACTSPI_00050 [Candidatus Heimdallarchaeaceae archaeon]